MYQGQLFSGIESETPIEAIESDWVNGCPACTEYPFTPGSAYGITRPTGIPIGRMDATLDDGEVIVLIELLCSACGFGEVGYERARDGDLAKRLREH